MPLPNGFLSTPNRLSRANPLPRDRIAHAQAMRSTITITYHGKYTTIHSNCIARALARLQRLGLGVDNPLSGGKWSVMFHPSSATKPLMLGDGSAWAKTE